MKIPTRIELLKYAAVSFAVVFIVGECVLLGVKHGESTINAKWQKEKRETAEALLVLNGKIKQQEFGHRQETTRIDEQLRKTEDRYEEATSALVAERTQRLRQSDQRAATYAAQAQAGSDQCRSVAGHAAELDRSLEEGRGLVGELKEALGRRDDQLRLLGAQINNDRSLLDAN